MDNFCIEEADGKLKAVKISQKRYDCLVRGMKLKTVVQVSQYKNGRYVKGSKSYTAYNCYASEIATILEPFRVRFRKGLGEVKSVVRIQIQEFHPGRKYSKKSGSCITIYNQTVNEVFPLIVNAIENN